MSDGQAMKITTDQDVDMETLAKLLDEALTSDNPMVKDQLKKLMMTVALTNSVDPLSKAMGPFASLTQEVRNLDRRLRNLESDSLRGRRVDPLIVQSKLVSPNWR